MTPEAAKLMRPKFATRAEYRRFYNTAIKPPRNPGSLRPFHRIQGLVQAAIDANQAAIAAQTAANEAAIVSPWRVLTFWLEAKRQRALEILAAKAIAAQIVAAKARAALDAYKSRGHGCGSLAPRFGAARSKYMPHQGPRECERRQCQIVSHRLYLEVA